MNVLITGGYGCIGAETAKWLLRNTSAKVVIASRQVSEQRSTRVFDAADRERLSFVPLDVRDQEQIQRLLEQHEISRVVHLAALQTPDCNAQRDLGLQINLAGTQNLIEAMKRCRRPPERLVFASSIAVYGPRSAYPAGRVPMLAPPQPVNVYGAWKLAGEYVAKFFHQDTGAATLTLRPGVLYGPGRDAGLTSTPTTAMKRTVLGLPYTIPFRSRQDYQFAPDVGAAFGLAVSEPFEGYGLYTLPGWTLETSELAAAIAEAAEQLGLTGCDVRVGDEEVPFICDLDFDAFLQRFPSAPRTPVNQAVRRSLEVFQEQAARGWLSESAID